MKQGTKVNGSLRAGAKAKRKLLGVLAAGWPMYYVWVWVTTRRTSCRGSQLVRTRRTGRSLGSTTSTETPWPTAHS